MKRLAAALAGLAILLGAGDAFAAGFLQPRDGSPPIRIQSHRVTADVADGLARTTVRQTFVNPHDRILEAIYLFPLPEGAALLDVAMEVGGQRLEGLLVERKKARAVYNEIVRQQRDPALVEQVGRNLFKLSVFPVVPNEPTVVELTYIQHVPLHRGAFRYVYPLATGGEAAETEEDLTVSVTIRSSVPFLDVAATDGMEIVRAGPGEATAVLERSGAALSEDVVVTGRVEVGEPTLTVSTWRGEGDEGIFLAVVTPPVLPEDRLVPRDVILLLDTSGSMKGEKIEQAKASALYLLGNLRPADRVNIVRFSSGAEAFAKELVPMDDVSGETLGKLREFVTAIEAKGGTNLADGLRLALAAPAAEGRARTVVLLSDGKPTVGDTEPKVLLELTKSGTATGLRVYPFGVGTDVDAGLLRGIARIGRGQAEIFRPRGEIESRLTSFLDRTSAPVLADVMFEVEGVEIHDVFPRPLPDAYLGEQVVIAGRYRGAGGANVTVSAVLGDRRVGLTTNSVFPGEAGGDRAVRHLFARMKLGWLEEQYRLRSGLSDEAYFAAIDRGAYTTSDEIIEEIVSVSLEHGVQCAYTSFLVLLPEDRARLDPRDLVALSDARERARDKILEDPVIKDAKVSDHNETDNDMPFEESLGRDGVSDAPFEGPSTGAAIGIGGGAGGSFGGRGGHRNLRAEGGGAKTESAVDLGLEWLKSQQAEDGSFDTDDRAVTNTSLALLAYLGAGETHKHGRYKLVVKNAAKWLKQNQDPEGCFGPRDRPNWLHAHAIGTLAMAEIYAMTLSPLFKQSGQQAIDFLVANVGEAPDASILPWFVAAMKSAKAGGLEVADSAFDLARKQYDADVALPAASAFPPSTERASIAAETIARIFAGENPNKSERIAVLMDEALLSPPVVDDPDLVAVYFGTLAAFHCGGEPWKRWNEALKASLVPGMVTGGEGVETGSWDPIGVDAEKLGRVGTTALATMCLEVYYRYARVFGTK